MIFARRAALLASRGARHFCELEERGKAKENAYFRMKERAALDKLKAKLEGSDKAIDEHDEKARLAKILDKVGVPKEVRDGLKVELLLWKHDEDENVEYH